MRFHSISGSLLRTLGCLGFLALSLIVHVWLLGLPFRTASSENVARAWPANVEICGFESGGESACGFDPVPAPLTVWEIAGGAYSYEQGCNVNTFEDEIDPISTLILAGNGISSEAGAATRIVQRLQASGLTTGINETYGTYNLNTAQHFVDFGGCVEGEISQADHLGADTCIINYLPNVCAITRWHVRCSAMSLPNAWSGYWSSCTPHWDASDGSVADGCGHFVQADFNGRPEDNHLPGSGFDAGRDWLWWALVTQGGMTSVGSVYFDNRHLQNQCNGNHDLARSDGKVNLIVLH